MKQEEEISEELEITPKFRNFDWEKAKSFYYVAKLGSFANAGRFLNISQSALSRQVIYLEQHLRYPLFSRHSREGIKLTRKGEELFDIVERTFVDLKTFTYNPFIVIDGMNKRKIRIATTHPFASYIFTPLLLKYQKDHPDLIFELIGEDHILDILLNDVDITIHPLITKTGIIDELEERGVQKELLFSIEKRLYASGDYIKRYGEPKKVEDLKHHRLLAFGHPEQHPYGDVNWILELGLPKGKLHKPIFTSNSVESLIEAAKEGVGIVSSYKEYSIVRNSKLKNVLPNIKSPPLKEYIIYPLHLKEDAEILKIKDFLAQELESDQP